MLYSAELRSNKTYKVIGVYKSNIKTVTIKLKHNNVIIKTTPTVLSLQK